MFGIGTLLGSMLKAAKNSDYPVALTIFLLIFCFAIVMIGWYVEYRLWNAVVPQIFGLNEVTFWQMAGLDWLLHMLFSRNSSSSREKEEEE